MDKSGIAIDLFDRYAERYQEKYMDQSAYHNALDQFIALLTNEEASILDIACGPGNITRYLLDKIPAAKILGIDLAERMLALARRNNPEADFRCLDARDISQLEGPFSGIVCAFCLPYLSKEESVRLIRDASMILPSGGVLYMSTMEGDPNNSGWQGPSSGEAEKLYIHYHQADYLKQALLDNHFALTDEERLISGEQKEVTDLILIAQKEKLNG